MSCRKNMSLAEQLLVLKPLMFLPPPCESGCSGGGQVVEAAAAAEGGEALALAKREERPRVIVPSNHQDTLFWCLYIAKNGYDEYSKYFELMKERRKNVEMEIKGNMMEEMRRSQPALLSRRSRTEYKFTKKKLSEIFSGMVVIGCLTCFYTALAICRSFGLGVFVVDEQKKLYLSINAGRGGEGEEDEEEDEVRFFVVYKRPRGTFGVALSPPQHQQQRIVDEYAEVILGEKPLRPLAAYKKDELLAICKKIWPADQEKMKTQKKEEIYTALWDHMNF